MANVRIIDGVNAGADTAEAKNFRLNFKLGIVAAKFNPMVVDLLLKGAMQEAAEQDLVAENITVVKVPGAFELGYAARMMFAASDAQDWNVPDAIVAFGAVIRGQTSHYDYVCAESARGIQDAAIDAGKPVIFGVLTTENELQAVERADPEKLNKGGQAVKDAVEMAALSNAFRGRAPK